MKKLISSCLLLFSGALLLAQSSDLDQKVLFTVADDTVTAGEYMAVYNKNRNLGEDIDPKTPREYLDLYINFKLKVHEAKEMGMDTIPSFVREYGSYRDQLAKPYLNDKDVTQELIKEAYKRMKTDVRASHIMIAVDAAASPEDTLEAYKKITNIKKQINKGGDFDALAEEYSADTYSAKNGGDLGYFTVFNMVYPFENAAYKADIGEVVGPIRTRFGYHLVKTTDKRKARGEVQVSHILVLDNDKNDGKEVADPEKKVKEIYEKLQAGEDFATLAKQYSEDPTSAQKGGRLQEFGINKMYPEFEDAAFLLENVGEYTQPVKTPIGWHIIKLDKKLEIPAFEEAEPELKSKLDRDDRSQQSQISVIKRLKKDYNYREYPKVMKTAFNQVDESLLKRAYSVENVKSGEKTLFEFADKSYSVEDFLNFVEENQRGIRGSSVYGIVSDMYDAYSEGKLIEYEKSRLVDKYPEFRLLSREYFEGILLFDLTEKKVWKKSVTDSAGLREFYEANKANYMWKDRYQAYIIDANSKKVAKKAAKMISKGSNVADVQKELNEDSQLNVKIDSGLFEKGSNKMLVDVAKEVGTSDYWEKDGRTFVVVITEVMPAGNKSFEEARGMVISNYQTYLEEQWLKELKEKYEVKLNDDVLKKVVAELESQS